MPEEFYFRQNDVRVGDMESEERALANLAAQELDQIRVLQKLPKDSDLYKHKKRLHAQVILSVFRPREFSRSYLIIANF